MIPEAPLFWPWTLIILAVVVVLGTADLVIAKLVERAVRREEEQE